MRISEDFGYEEVNYKNKTKKRVICNGRKNKHDYIIVDKKIIFALSNFGYYKVKKICTVCKKIENGLFKGGIDK